MDDNRTITAANPVHNILHLYNPGREKTRATSVPRIEASLAIGLFEHWSDGQVYAASWVRSLRFHITWYLSSLLFRNRNCADSGGVRWYFSVSSRRLTLLRFATDTAPAVDKLERAESSVDIHRHDRRARPAPSCSGITGLRGFARFNRGISEVFVLFAETPVRCEGRWLSSRWRLTSPVLVLKSALAACSRDREG